LTLQLTHGLNAPGFNHLNLSSDKKSADAILDTSLTSQAYVSWFQKFLLSTKCNLHRYAWAAGFPW
jgi:hypothetical protein